MNVKIEQTSPSIKVDPGDIVKYHDSGHIHVVTTIPVYSVVKKADLDGVSLCGNYWLGNAAEAVADGRAELYKADEWELVLRRKEAK